MKGFLIGVLCLCIVGLAGLFVLRPSLTAAEADALKRTYSEAGPGADRSGALPAGEEPASFVDFSSLRADYPDVKGWLTIPGTVVDYPVLQSSAAQPEYYLRRNYRGEWRMAGSLFFQYDCTLQSKNTVIYGHNMTDGSMFGVLSHRRRRTGVGGETPGAARSPVGRHARAGMLSQRQGGRPADAPRRRGRPCRAL